MKGAKGEETLLSCIYPPICLSCLLLKMVFFNTTYSMITLCGYTSEVSQKSSCVTWLLLFQEATMGRGNQYAPVREQEEEGEK